MFNDRVSDHVITTKTNNKIIRYRFDTSWIPDLQGTEKQVKWATSIRNKLLATLRYTQFGRLGGDEFIDAYDNRKSAHKSFSDRDFDGLPGEIMTDNCEMYAALRRLEKDWADVDWEGLLMFLVSLDQAKIWIENKDVLIADNALELMLSAHNAATKGSLKPLFDKFNKAMVAA